MKTRIINLLVLAAFVSTSLSAAIVKENRSVSEFNKITSSSGIDVVFVQENKHSLQLEADAENLPKIESSVVNGTLVLKIKNNDRLRSKSKITAYVSAKNIDEINISGGADFDTNKLTNNTKLIVKASGGSDFDAQQLNAKNCELTFSGGADCDIKQFSVQTVSLNFSGGSDGDIHFVNADSITAKASGGSDLKLTGKTRQIDINVSGGSDGDVSNLTYTTINANKSGGSNIKK